LLDEGSKPSGSTTTAHTQKVWAFVGMKDIKMYYKKKRLERYITARILELRNNICKQACKYGTVDDTTRQLYTKYKNKLKELNNGKI
tara:strand:+ start:3547 stop:3807 length:261 start_codon:yes stop_codon:yes gene_type:complete